MPTITRQLEIESSENLVLVSSLTTLAGSFVTMSTPVSSKMARGINTNYEAVVSSRFCLQSYTVLTSPRRKTFPQAATPMIPLDDS